MNREAAINIIHSIYDKYESYPYMLSKTNNYIINQLPTILDNINTTHIERQQRIEELTQNQDQFIESFLNNNQYFYIPSTENFFFYDGIHYQQFNEDDILYHILSTISKEKELSSWKQSTKNAIMKRIRENSLIKSIPESETIQFVIDSLCPLLFRSRTETKYFLTILGDNILRKNTNIIHYIDAKSKHFIRNFNNFCQMWIGQNFYQTFKHKYHDHDYNDCRVITISDFVKVETVWNSIITQTGLDAICVACHYSERYGSSDNYAIQYSNDGDLINDVFYLKNNTTVDIIKTFVNEYLNQRTIKSAEADLHSSGSLTTEEMNSAPEEQNQIFSGLNIESRSQTINIDALSRNTQITWRDMQYLWKNFLESKRLPSIMFFQTLKTQLITSLSQYYNETTDSFIGICSKHLPEIQKFLAYWEETIVVDENEMDFEIEEIIILFRKWCNANNEHATNLNDKQILDVISYFYPDLEIERDKYVSHIRSILWDKQMDIQIALDNLKNSIREKNGQSNGLQSPSLRNNISIYDAYRFYCKYYSNLNSVNKLIVGKAYFEKYVFDNLSQYIVDSRFLSYEWYQI